MKHRATVRKKTRLEPATVQLLEVEKLALLSYLSRSGARSLSHWMRDAMREKLEKDGAPVTLSHPGGE